MHIAKNSNGSVGKFMFTGGCGKNTFNSIETGTKNMIIMSNASRLNKAKNNKNSAHDAMRSNHELLYMAIILATINKAVNANAVIYKRLPG